MCHGSYKPAGSGQLFCLQAGLFSFFQPGNIMNNPLDIITARTIYLNRSCYEAAFYHLINCKQSED